MPQTTERSLMRTRFTILSFTMVLLGAGLAHAERVLQEHTRASSRDRADRSSVQRSSPGDDHSASRGSVRYHQSSRAASGHRDRTVERRPGDATVTRDSRAVTRDSAMIERSYDAGRSQRHYASSGSVRYRRPPTVHLPARPPHREGGSVVVRRYPRYGTRVTRLPAGHRVVVHRGHRYFCADGIYYRQYGSGVYTVVRPPVGARLSFMPVGYVNATISDRPYYRYENTYYVREIVDDKPTYVVVVPPRDTIIDELPPDTYRVEWRKRVYYVDIYEESAYVPVIVDGHTRYRPTDLKVDVEFDDGEIEIEIDD